MGKHIYKRTIHLCNMEKLIINNQSDLSMIDVMRLISEIISWGRISKEGKQYCYVTSNIINKAEYHIISDVNKKSDKFTIYKAR